MRSAAVVLGLLLACSTAAAAEKPAARLWDAARQNNEPLVRELLAQGVDVNSQNAYGATALTFACDRGHLNIARLLIDAGADVNLKDKFYRASPLSWAAGGGHGEVVALLLAHNAQGADDALRTAAEKGFLSVARAVIASGQVGRDHLAACRQLATDRKQTEVAALIAASLAKPDGKPESAGVHVPEQLLAAYAGTYHSEEGLEFRFDVADGRLRISSPYLAPTQLTPVDDRTFRFFDATFEFLKEQDRIVGMIRKTGSASTRFRRVANDAVATRADAKAKPDIGPDAEALRLADLAVSGANWPSFRGSQARGIADGQRAPATWDVPAGSNVRWRTAIPGLGHSSPVVWGDRIFLTTAAGGNDAAGIRTGLYGDVASVKDESPHAWQVLCIDKTSGQIRWQATARQGVPRFKRHPKATHANPTPATDGRHLVAFFGSEGLYCYDLDGRLRWSKMLGDLNSCWFYDPDYQWGFASSPILHDRMVIVQCDVQPQSFIAAFALEDGKELWRTARDEIPSWASPTVHEAPNGPLLITNGSRFARGYDARDGREIWRFSGHSEICVPTPFVADGLILVASGYRPIKPIYAIRLDAQGDISLPAGKTANDFITWSNPQGGPYLPTPLVYRNCLYVCSDSGILSCYDVRSGQRHYQQRLRGGGAKSFAASPIAADGKLYLTSEDGVVLVVETGPDFRLLHTNPVGDPCLATPAISQGLVILRTTSSLIAVGERGAEKR